MKHMYVKKLLFIGLVLTLLLASAGSVYAEKPVPEPETGNVAVRITSYNYLEFDFTWTGTVANAIYATFINDSNGQSTHGVWSLAKRTSSGMSSGGVNIDTLPGSGSYRVVCSPVIYNFGKGFIRVQGPEYSSESITITK